MKKLFFEARNVKMIFCLVLPNFGGSTGFWKGSRLPPFSRLIRAACTADVNGSGTMAE
jgi:hypothetical protein